MQRIEWNFQLSETRKSVWERERWKIRLKLFERSFRVNIEFALTMATDDKRGISSGHLEFELLHPGNENRRRKVKLDNDFDKPESPQRLKIHS